MRNYKYLIFDVDDTLLDYYSAFLSAQKNAAAAAPAHPKHRGRPENSFM